MDITEQYLPKIIFHIIRGDANKIVIKNLRNYLNIFIRANNLMKSCYV